MTQNPSASRLDAVASGRHEVDVASLLQEPECSIVRAAGLLAETGNSVLRSCPQVRIAVVFAPSVDVQVTASLVEIAGPSEEPVHFHTSHVIGVVISGRGYLLTGVGDRLPLEERDVVVVPKGVLHVFEADPGGRLSYIAYEVSRDEIDYQKHFYS